MSRKAAATLILLGLSWFAVLGLHRPDRPGLQYDECLFIPPLLGAPNNFTMTRFGADGPVLMHLPYLGGLKSILMKPVFSRWGISVTTIRYPMIVIGLLAIFLTAVSAWNFLGRREAVLVAALMALDPAVLHHVREDWGPSALALLLRSAVLWTFFLGLGVAKPAGARPTSDRRRIISIYLSGLLAGLGVWNKADFLLFLIALSIAALIHLRPQFTNIRRKDRIMFVCAFLLGALPAWSFWLGHFRLLIQSVSGAGHPFSWLDLYGKFMAIFDTLRGFLPIRTFLGQGSLNPKSTLLPYLLIAVFIAAIWLRKSLGKHALWSNGLIPFFTTLFLLQFFSVWFIPQTSGSHHFFMLVPAAPLLAAGLTFMVLDLALVGAGAKKAATVLLCIPIVICGMISSMHAETLLDRRGGAAEWSPEIYELAECVKRHPPAHYVFLDWGMANQLTALLGIFDHEEIFWSLAINPPEPSAMNHLDKLLSDPQTVWVANEPPHVIFDQPRLRLAERVNDLGLIYVENKFIPDTDHKPLYHLFQIVPGK